MRAHVSCVIEKGDPPFTITWLKDREPLSAEGLKIIGLDTHSSTVVVDQLAASHSGNYTCRAANEVAAVEHTAQLVVSGKVESTFRIVHGMTQRHSAPFLSLRMPLLVWMLCYGMMLYSGLLFIWFLFIFVLYIPRYSRQSFISPMWIRKRNKSLLKRNRDNSFPGLPSSHLNGHKLSPFLIPYKPF